MLFSDRKAKRNMSNSTGAGRKTGRNKQNNQAGGKSIGVNAVLNFIKVGASVIFPLITFPYTSRVLQVENIGKVNYATSIISYFALFAALGITTYGVREGSRRKQGHDFDRFASEIFSLNLLTTAISYAVLFVMLLTVPKFRDYRAVILIQSMTIIMTTLGIEWVNTVYEDFLYITIRSLAVQVICMLALFVFIHKPEDYLKYACINVMSSSLMCIANWVYCRRYVHIKVLFSKVIFQHLYPMFIFFANSLAITIYVSSDTTMLGWIVGDYYTGLYAVSVKIYQLVKYMMTAVYTVTIPRLSRFAGLGERQKYRTLLTQICSCVILLLIPCMTGLAVYAEDIIRILSGESYLPAVRSLQILSVALLFAVGSGVVVNCINTPNGFEKTSLSATISAAAVNVGLNIFMIPMFRHDGAALTTVIAEAMVLIICLVRLRDINYYMDVREVLTQIGYAAIGSVLILVISFALGRLALSPLPSLVLGIICSVAGYVLLLAVGRNRYFMTAAAKVLHRKA